MTQEPAGQCAGCDPTGTPSPMGCPGGMTDRNHVLLRKQAEAVLNPSKAGTHVRVSLQSSPCCGLVRAARRIVPPKFPDV